MTARARAFAAFGAYLCLATHLVGVLHALVVRHATCPGHGEVIHGGAVAAAPARVVLEGATVRVAADAEAVDDHCLFVATRRREMAALAPAPQAAPVAADLALLDARPALAAVTPLAILRLAPKTSPPIAA